ncbi:MAG: hypothetical protein ACN6N0_16600, partial [Microvirgula sp.]
MKTPENTEISPMLSNNCKMDFFINGSRFAPAVAAHTHGFYPPSNTESQSVLLRIELDAIFIKYAVTIDVHQPPEVRK